LTGNLWPGGSSEVANGLLTVVILAGVVYATTRLLASDVGLEVYVLGVNEGAAASMGVRTARRQLQLFVPPTLVQTTAELSLLIMLFVGGRRSVLGAVLGAVAIEYFSGISNFVSIHILLIEGVLITVVLLIEPEGLAGIAGQLWRRLSPLLTVGRRAAPAVISPVPAHDESVGAGNDGA